MSRAGEVAEVGGQKISEQEFSESLRQQQDRLRGMLGRNFDASLLDSPAMRREVLDGMISQRLLMQHAARNSSDRVRRDAGRNDDVDPRVSGRRKVLQGALRHRASEREDEPGHVRRRPAPRSDGAADQQRARGLGLRVEDGGRTSSRSCARSSARSPSTAVQADARRVQIAADTVRAFYDSNPGRFQVPEEVQVEYLVLSADALLAAEQVDPQEVTKYYESNSVEVRRAGAAPGEPHPDLGEKRRERRGQAQGAERALKASCRSCARRRDPSPSSRRRSPAIRARRRRAATSGSSREA